MYVPKYHAQTDIAAAQALIDAFPLGTWVAPSAEGLIANHIPFLLDRSRGRYGTLLGHVSRANTVWEKFSTIESSIVMFQGPQSYITPNWYPGKQEHGEVVPTWNYAVTHVHGVPRAIHDEDWLLDFLSRLTAANEASQNTPWRLKDAPADYISRLLRAVVGIEIPIERIVGKLKASQDEAMQDRLGTIVGLASKGDSNASAMAELVREQVAKTEAS